MTEAGRRLRTAAVGPNSLDIGTVKAPSRSRLYKAIPPWRFLGRLRTDSFQVENTKQPTFDLIASPPMRSYAMLSLGRQGPAGPCASAHHRKAETAGLRGRKPSTRGARRQGCARPTLPARPKPYRRRCYGRPDAMRRDGCLGQYQSGDTTQDIHCRSRSAHYGSE